MIKHLFFFILFMGIFSLNAQSNECEWENQKSTLQTKGYLWIKNFFSEDQVRLLKSMAEQIHKDAKNILTLQQTENSIPPCMIIVAEANNSEQVCRTEDMLSFYPELQHLIEGTITAYISKLLEEPYVLFKDKLNFKLPGGGAFPPHQDFPAFDYFGPREHITALIAIDAADLENGCLQIADNWQETFADEPKIDVQLLKAGTAILPFVEGGKEHGSIQAQYAKKISWLPLKTQPGDLVLFNSYIPHFSEINQSKSSRRVLFFTLNKLKEGNYKQTYYHTKRNDPYNPAFHFATPTKARGKE